ncbi:MAG: glycosyltransferase family 2 protein [Saprospiraceae bacterium]
MPPDISIVIPVYNSEGILAELNAQVRKALAGFPYELILVDDRSRDQSWKAIQQLAQQDEHVLGIRLRKNSGQDNALMAGMRAARGNYVVIMDDDLQHSPFDILKLHEACGEYDVCFAKFTTKKQAAWKNLGSWLNGKVAEKLIDKPPHIYLSPFKIIKKDVVGEIIKYNGPYPYIDGLLFMVTAHVTQLEGITHYRRHEGRSNYNLWRSIKVFLKLATNFSIVPLRLATVLGFASAILSFLLSVGFFIEYLLSDRSPEGWTSLMLITLFLGGVVLIAIGIMGEYVGRVFLYMNRSANVFSVAETASKKPIVRDETPMQETIANYTRHQ